MTLHPTLSTIRIACAAGLLALPAAPAFAVNRDMVQLQTQVQQLQDAVQHLQQSNDERMGVLRDLVQQSADSVNKMALSLDSLEKRMNTQQETANGKVDQVSGQVQTLNDSVDEVKARLNALEKAMQAIQSQQQSINAALQNMAPSTGTPAGTSPAAGAGPVGGEGAASNVPGNSPFATQQGPPRVPAPAASNAPPVGDLYRQALADFMAAKYPLASSEFHQVIENYPDDSLSGNAYFYLGEIDWRAGHYPEAIKNYDQVIQRFPASQKVPASRLHKASALLSMKDRDGGIAEMRALIQRFPNSPEAQQARTKLSGLGVSAAPRRPS